MVKPENSNKALVLVDSTKPLQVIMPPKRMRMKQSPRKRTAVQSPKKLAEKTVPSSRKRTRTIEDEDNEVKQSPTKRATRSVTQQEKDSHKINKKEKKNHKKKNDKTKKIEEEADEDEEKEEEEQVQVQKPTKKEANQKSRSSPKTKRLSPKKKNNKKKSNVKKDYKKKKIQEEEEEEEEEEEDEEKKEDEDEEKEEEEQVQVQKPTKSRSSPRTNKKKDTVKDKKKKKVQEEEEEEEEEQEEEEEDEDDDEEEDTDDYVEDTDDEDTEDTDDEEQDTDDAEEEDLQKPTKKAAHHKSRCSPKTRGPILRKRIQKQKQQKQMAKRTAVKKRFKKLKKKVKKEVQPKPKQIQFRSSFQSFVKLLKDIKFTKLQKEKIRKTPFANLIFAVVDENMTEAYLRKSDLHALSLIRRYEGSGGRFNLGTKSVRITAHEFALIFGITYGPNRIKPTTKPRMPETRFANEICVRGARIMTNSSLKEYFQRAVKKKDEESANDVARVLTLYLISTVFIPSTASRVSWNLIDFIEDLDKISSYDWATFFTDELIRQLNDNIETPASTGGCISGLLYWFCEHVALVCQADPTNFPRFVKWRLTDLSVGLANNPLDVLDPLIVNDSKLEATELEKELLGFVEVPEDDHVKPEDEQDKDGDDADHDDANSELRKENEILREKIKRLTEENEQKDATIAHLRKRISELQDETYEETVAELNFEVETAHVERDFFVKEVVHKEVEICNVLVENDIIAEKLERAEGTIDDIETHCITQQFKTSESVEKDAEAEGKDEKEEEQEEECGPEHQMVPDAEVERTTIEAFTGVLAENSPKPTKKKKKQVDPSSLVHNVKNETRIEKREEGFVYEDMKKVKKNKKEMDDVIPKWKVEKTKLGKWLEEEDKALLTLFYDLNQGHANEEIWTDNETSYTITFKSIIKLLDELDMGNEVIDGYTSMLKKEQEVKQLMHGNSVFFTSSCWTLIKMTNQSPKKYLLDSKLEQLYDEVHERGLDYFRYLFFPMNSSGNKTTKNSPYHWTVLVYDMQEQEWKHYNSLKPRKKEKSGDPYLKDAAIVKDAVEKFMKELEERRSNQPQFNLLTPIESIFKDGAQLRTVQEAPQQNSASVDCGPIVCYVIKKIAELEEIPQKLEKEDVSAFRVHLVHKILHDVPRSWTKEKWQDKNLAHNLC